MNNTSILEDIQKCIAVESIAESMNDATKPNGKVSLGSIASSFKNADDVKKFVEKNEQSVENTKKRLEKEGKTVESSKLSKVWDFLKMVFNAGATTAKFVLNNWPLILASAFIVACCIFGWENVLLWLYEKWRSLHAAALREHPFATPAAEAATVALKTGSPKLALLTHALEQSNAANITIKSDPKSNFNIGNGRFRNQVNWLGGPEMPIWSLPGNP